MPSSLFKDLDIDVNTQNQRISFAIYRKTSFFITSEKKEPNSASQANAVRRKNSFVISGSVKGQRLTNLTDPIKTTYQPLDVGRDETTACVFWNFTAGKSGLGNWSSVGCSYQGIVDDVVTCHCTHLTNFAILMDVHIDDRDETHDKVLSVISYIGCAISLFGLVLTIFTMLIFKDLRCKVPTRILLNFCFALSLTLIVFLVAAERSNTSSFAACRVAAIALHYFVLVVFVWTSIQAYSMYLAFVKVMPRYHSKFILKCCVVGWGLPAVIVIITAAIAIEEYGDENFCRVQGLPFQVGFLTPVVLILVVNSIAFVLIIRSLLTAGSKVAADKRATGLQHARRASAILDFWCLYSTVCFPRKLKSNTRTYCVDKVNNLSQVGSKVILGLLQKEGFMKLTREQEYRQQVMCAQLVQENLRCLININISNKVNVEMSKL
ncbi:plexin-B2-like isoform X1 [Paramuricea clavata]|uniref:Plexin-B2-like isoform X1 n=1 Tax=Paramuricea clavata TaxID=317549 RepID=A0A6S7LNC9_PARCT|nr:plexin-B2-like isoform X1 [Paramuricea clavata]